MKLKVKLETTCKWTEQQKIKELLILLQKKSTKYKFSSPIDAAAAVAAWRKFYFEKLKRSLSPRLRSDLFDRYHSGKVDGTFEMVRQLSLQLLLVGRY